MKCAQNNCWRLVICASIAFWSVEAQGEDGKVNRKPAAVPPPAHSGHSKGKPIAGSASCLLSPADLASAEKAARAGDGDAASRLYSHYAIGMQGAGGKDIYWLYRGAELGQTTCLMNLANFIKAGLLKPEPYGKSKPEAVKKLLLAAAAKADPDAHRMLADCYADGYFGTVDQALARKHLRLAAQADKKQ